MYDDETVGFWLGVDAADGLAKFNIGDADNYLIFDGADLLVSGDIEAATITGTVAIVGGELAWAGGLGVASDEGISIIASSSVSLDRAYAMVETNGSEIAFYSAYTSFTFGGAEPGLASHAVLRSLGTTGVMDGAHARTQIEALSTTGYAHIVLDLTNDAGSLTIDFVIDDAGNASSDFGGLVLSSLGDAVAATDALNRQTADGRYLAKSTGWTGTFT